MHSSCTLQTQHSAHPPRPLRVVIACSQHRHKQLQQQMDRGPSVLQSEFHAAIGNALLKIVSCHDQVMGNITEGVAAAMHHS